MQEDNISQGTNSLKWEKIAPKRYVLIKTQLFKKEYISELWVSKIILKIKKRGEVNIKFIYV